MIPPGASAATTSVDRAQEPFTGRRPPNGLPRLSLVWVAWAITMVFTALGLGLLALSYQTRVPQAWGFRGFAAIWAVPYATVGALIASRRPGHRIGLLFSGAGLLAGLLNFASEYAIVALLARPGVLPGGALAAWFGSWLWVPFLALINAFLVLLFPTGHLLSPRWRLVAWLSVAWVVLLWLQFAFMPGPLWNFSFADNPFAIPSLAGVLHQARNLAIALGIVTTALAAISVLLRLRRSHGDERQQLKWFVYAASLVIMLQPVSIASLATPLIIATQIGLPVAVGIAILKYRLYDIDLVIRRTLIYSVLSVILAVIYFVSVGLLQVLVVRWVSEASQVAVIASTLAVAVLFTPLRRRIQGFIDQRYYRRKYNAARTLADFAARVRDETDLEKLSEQLLAVVDETLQPASVALWLRDVRRQGQDGSTGIRRQQHARPSIRPRRRHSSLNHRRGFGRVLHPSHTESAERP
jgi:hypothetical protein